MPRLTFEQIVVDANGVSGAHIPQYIDFKDTVGVAHAVYVALCDQSRNRTVLTDQFGMRYRVSMVNLELYSQRVLKELGK
jgi:hypothetical protein